MTKTETETLAIIFRTGFTFKSDSHWSSYRQATSTLSSLERKGVIRREGRDGCASYVLTQAGREAHLWPISFEMALAA